MAVEIPAVRPPDADARAAAVARIDSENVASCRLVEALGFLRTARVEGADHFKGRVSDEVVYERALAG